MYVATFDSPKLASTAGDFEVSFVSDDRCPQYDKSWLIPIVALYDSSSVLYKAARASTTHYRQMKKVSIYNDIQWESCRFLNKQEALY